MNPPTPSAPDRHPSPGSIVVGIDGSASADRALEWAAHAAALDHRPLTIMYAVDAGALGRSAWSGLAGTDVSGIAETMRESGRELVANAARRAARHAPGVTIHRMLSNRDPREELFHLAHEAHIVVVGSRGRGPIASLLLGSVSIAVTGHAVCPVVVVRHSKGAPPRGGILVEADGTEQSQPAIEFAYRMASLRAVILTVVYVCADRAAPRAGEPSTTLEDERMHLVEATAGMQEKFPDVQVRPTLAYGDRDTQLILASHHADLVVVARRHVGPLTPLSPYAVVPSVVEHALCDVAVVPGGSAR